MIVTYEKLTRSFMGFGFFRLFHRDTDEQNVWKTFCNYGWPVERQYEWIIYSVKSILTNSSEDNQKTFKI